MFRKKKIEKIERMPDLNKRISYVADGLYGMETDENGKFICASKLDLQGEKI